jgi:hypothetical protein
MPGPLCLRLTAIRRPFRLAGRLLLSEADPEEETRRKADQEAKSAEEAAAQARYELQARIWSEASPEQRRRWVSETDFFFRHRFVIDGPPPNSFLMAALKGAMLPEAETKSPQEAAA